jgi:hypothetical protein
MMGVEARVLKLIEFEPITGHWLWTGNLTPRKRSRRGEGYTTSGGYGRISFKGVVNRAIEAGLVKPGSRAVTAHRYLYWCMFGEIPADPATGQTADLDHDKDFCPGRLHHCCSPQHITAVTSALNRARGVDARRVGSHQSTIFPQAEYEIGVLQRQ